MECTTQSREQKAIELITINHNYNPYIDIHPSL